MAKETAVKNGNGSAKLIQQYNTIKDRNSTEARKIRKQLRTMGLSVRDLVKDDKEPAKKAQSAPRKEVKKAIGKVRKPVTASTRKAVDEDEGEE